MGHQKHQSSTELDAVDSAGFEPAASALRRQHSYQLSYEPLTSIGWEQYKSSPREVEVELSL